MSKPTLIIVTGLPCTGKTTLAKKISEEFALPIISKDTIKEILFNSLGWSDRAWSKKLGLASYPILFHFTESLLRNKISCIAESNFVPEYDDTQFARLRDKIPFSVIQILCSMDGQTRYERFIKRSSSGERHPGHKDSTNIDEFKNMLINGSIAPIKTNGLLMTVDTTDFSAIDYEQIFSTIAESFR